jgi:hypothetical protein
MMILMEFDVSVLRGSEDRKSMAERSMNPV